MIMKRKELIEKKTELIEIRKATSKEREQNNAETVFIRKDRSGNEYTIYSCKVYDSWEQWGVPKEILSDNVDDIEEKYSK
tara:strand:- start:843 stop:1082 length:240 start_codon:yes stop_codon:yes gene_type:complete